MEAAVLARKPQAILHHNSPLPSPTSPKPSRSMRFRVNTTFRKNQESEDNKESNEVVDMYKTLRSVNKRIEVDKINRAKYLINDVSLGVGLTDTIIESKKAISRDEFGLVEGTLIRDNIEFIYSVNEIASGNYSVKLFIKETNQSWILLVPLNAQISKVFHFNDIINKLLCLDGSISDIYYRVLKFDNVNNILVMACKIVLLSIKVRIIENTIVSSSVDSELFNNQIRALFLRCQEIFIIRIQCFIRKHLARIKLRKLYQNYIKVFEGCRRAEMRNEIRKNQKAILFAGTQRKPHNELKLCIGTSRNNKSLTTPSIPTSSYRMKDDDCHLLPRKGRKTMHELIILQKGLEDLRSNFGGSMLSVRNEIIQLKCDIQIQKKKSIPVPGSRNTNASVDSLITDSTVLVDKFQDELHSIAQKVNYLDDRFNDSMKIISETSAKTSEVIEMVHNMDHVIRSKSRVSSKHSHEKHPEQDEEKHDEVDEVPGHSINITVSIDKETANPDDMDASNDLSSHDEVEHVGHRHPHHRKNRSENADIESNILHDEMSIQM